MNWLRRAKWKFKLYWRLGSRATAWQKAKDRAWEKENARAWRRLMRLYRGNCAFKSDSKYDNYFDPFFMKRVMSVLVLDSFSEVKPFPKNAGRTKIRFTHAR
jgi:hypothetical protein